MYNSSQQGFSKQGFMNNMSLSPNYQQQQQQSPQTLTPIQGNNNINNNNNSSGLASTVTTTTTTMTNKIMSQQHPITVQTAHQISMQLSVHNTPPPNYLQYSPGSGGSSHQKLISPNQKASMTPLVKSQMQQQQQQLFYNLGDDQFQDIMNSK